MEQEKKLYPFRFCALKDEYAWGSEDFRLADLGYRDSLVAEGWLGGNTIGEIMDMFLDRVVGEFTFERYGRQFPFEVKFISVNGRMPLRVHPDDETASQRYDFLGKDKVWHILKAGKNARLMIGFRKDTDASEVYGKCLDNTVEDILNVVAPMEGQTFRIKAGTPHAASGDILIAEVSESSPLDFLMCGWGREVSSDEFDPQLNLVEALDFVNYSKFVPAAGNAEQFCVNRIQLTKPVLHTSIDADSPVCYVCTKGAASVQTSFEGIGDVSYPLTEGDLILVPAEIENYAVAPVAEGTVLLEVTVPPKNEPDAYINPEAPESLDDDQSEPDDPNDIGEWTV